MPKNPTLRELVDQLRELQAGRSAVTDLVTPGSDLHAVDRDKFTVLLNILDRDTERVLEHVDRVLQPD
ncbi:hypothetical protein [Alteromonadaceae phage B23]|nr:hypothetical protein [Alteromonadaceae phage B23]